MIERQFVVSIWGAAPWHSTRTIQRYAPFKARFCA